MNFSELKNFWRIEVVGDRERAFAWRRLVRRYRAHVSCRFLFWYRLAQFFNAKNSKFCRKIAAKLHDRTIEKFGIDVALDAKIGLGFQIAHLVGIVITRKAIVGSNFCIFQNVTIGQKSDASKPIFIGDNVCIGAGAIIIGDGISIGNNVSVGAGAFLNKSLPDDSVFLVKIEGVIISSGGGVAIDSGYRRYLRKNKGL